MGTLYIVATPIGNLQDITLRAVEILHTVPVIACEDTRKTGFLLQKIKNETNVPVEQLKNPRLISYYEENELQRIPEIIAALKDGLDIALVSDAGTPTISDPGFKLVRECAKEGIKVESIPGASSVITALTVSGLPTDKFTFLGYLPKKPGHRQTLLENIKKSSELIKQTIIFFESPFRIRKTLEELVTIFGDIDIVLARELTKMHEEVRREKISQALQHYEKANPKGEFVILFHL